jgi:hypothetical protein
MIAHRNFHRLTFKAAGVYNIAWGIYTICDPQWLFRFSRMPAPNYPEVFACIGLVIGLYGFLYLDVARAPEQNWRIAAVGLAGKLLGPIGLAFYILTGRWPLRSFVMCLTNDLIWWGPFGLYLRDALKRQSD